MVTLHDRTPEVIFKRTKTSTSELYAVGDKEDSVGMRITYNIIDLERILGGEDASFWWILQQDDKSEIVYNFNSGGGKGDCRQDVIISLVLEEVAHIYQTAIALY